jgi:hypothetical protein
MVNLNNNYFDLINDIATIITNNPFYMFVLYLGIFYFIACSIIKLFFRGVGSIDFKDDENITYAEEYKDNDYENDDDRFNYGFFKK